MFVALQFPEVLLADAARVVWALEELVNNEDVTLFVLGDTAYGEASVDGIAAGHMPTDLIVHFGTSTLDVSDGAIPVLNIYGERPVNVKEISKLILKETTDKIMNQIILVYDSTYTTGAKMIEEELSTSNILVRLGVAVSPNIASDQPSNSKPSCMMIGGLEVSFPEYDGTVDFYNNMLQQHIVCFLGCDGWLLNAVLMRCEGAVCVCVNPDGNGTDSPTLLPAPEVATSLRKRYYQVQRAAEAKVIGILVGTMGVSNFHSIVDRMVSLISSTGRKPYIFAVGNPNVAKLSNFAEVDAFCIIASAEASLLEARDFAIPVVTPYELEVALGVRPWDIYSTHFGELLQSELPTELSAGTDEETPAFSLISSELVDKRRKGVQLSFEVEEDENASSGVNASARSLTTYHSPATEFLCARSYQGLERRLGEDQPHIATEGRGGIACDYEEISRLESRKDFQPPQPPKPSQAPQLPHSNTKENNTTTASENETLQAVEYDSEVEGNMRENALDFLSIFDDSGDEED